MCNNCVELTHELLAGFCKALVGKTANNKDMTRAMARNAADFVASFRQQGEAVNIFMEEFKNHLAWANSPEGAAARPKKDHDQGEVDPT